MANVVCKKCNHNFDPSNYVVTGGSAMVGAVAGGLFGARLGIAGGPWGAIAGTIPCAIVGGVFAGLGVSKVTICPMCDHKFFI